MPVPVGEGALEGWYHKGLNIVVVDVLVERALTVTGLAFVLNTLELYGDLLAQAVALALTGRLPVALPVLARAP